MRIYPSGCEIGSDDVVFNRVPLLKVSCDAQISMYLWHWLSFSSLLDTGHLENLSSRRASVAWRDHPPLLRLLCVRYTWVTLPASPLHHHCRARAHTQNHMCFAVRACTRTRARTRVVTITNSSFARTHTFKDAHKHTRTLSITLKNDSSLFAKWSGYDHAHVLCLQCVKPLFFFSPTFLFFCAAAIDTPVHTIRLSKIQRAHLI